MLLYKYQLLCPRCHLIEHKFLVEKGITMGKIESPGCKCGYEGLIDMKCLGRYKREFVAGWKGNLLNTDVITTRIDNEDY